MSENGPSETGVHMAAIVAAFAVLAITSSVAETFELSPSVGAAGSVVFNAIVFGGAHLYLAARGKDGSVPVASRWRFLAFLGAVVVAAVAVVMVGGETEAAMGVDARSVGYGFVLVIGLAYLVTEARAGYRDTMNEPN